MKYVFDSSVALKTALPEEGSEAAARVMNEYARGMHTLIAPDIYPVEIAHAIARAERKKILNPPEGSQRLAKLLAILPDLHPYLPLLPRAFEIASDARIGGYDCLYLALAEQEQCDFLTADKKLFSLPHVCPFPE